MIVKISSTSKCAALLHLGYKACGFSLTGEVYFEFFLEDDSPLSLIEHAKIPINVKQYEDLKKLLVKIGFKHE